MAIGPKCPACGHPPPLRLLVWGTNKPFTCAGCGRRLKVTNSVQQTMFAIIALLAFLRFDDAHEGWLWPAGLFLLLAGLVALVSWIRMRVQPVAEEPGD